MLMKRLRDRIIGEYIHQADIERSRGRDFLCRDKKFECSSLPDQARQSLRASPSRHESESRTAMSKDGMGRGDSAVTGECEV
jgi:hypothetical protein